MKKRTKQAYHVMEIKLPENATERLNQVIGFLGLLLSETLAKRLVSIILLAIGISVTDVAGLAGLSERSLWTLKGNMEKVPIAELMTIKSGRGRKQKTADIEEQILAEIESNNYHTRQEIVDMIEEKFHMHISRSSVGRLLKKRHSVAEERVDPC